MQSDFVLGVCEKSIQKLVPASSHLSYTSPKDFNGRGDVSYTSEECNWKRKKLWQGLVGTIINLQ